MIQSKNGKITLVLVSLMMIGLFLFGLLNVLATSDIISTDPTKEINTNETTTDKLSDGDYQDSLRDTNIVQELIDNKYKSYDVSEKEILIEDLNNITIIEMKLVSEYKERVSEGTNIKVANILITNWGIKDLNLSKGIKSYDINDGYKLLNKEFKLKYKTVIAEKRCNKITDNKTLVETTECYIYDKEILTEFELLSELPQKEIEIGIFTDTILGEEIEWTITLDGIEILEWASYLVTDILSYYKLDVNSATQVDSVITTGNNGTVTGATYTASGYINGGYTFTDDQIAMTDNIVTSTRTVSLWMKRDGIPTGNEFVYGERVVDADISMNLYLRLDTGGARLWMNGPSYSEGTGAGINVCDNDWHMITGVLDGATAYIYIDGALNNSVSVTKSISSSGFLLGNHFTETGFAGDLDEVAIYNVALNATAISDLYDLQSAGISYPFEVECNLSGYVFDEDSTALNGANVTIWNQYDVSESYEDSTDSNGYWSLNVSNSTNTYMVGAYYNDSIIGQLKPYVSGSC